MQIIKLFLSIFLLPLANIRLGAMPMTELSVVEEEQPEVAPTPFRTELKLSEAQLEKLTQRAKRRIDELMQESGLQAGGDCLKGSWMDKRVKNQCVYDNDLEFRREEFALFRKSNLTRGVTKRFAREMSAKVSDDMLGTTPFFGAVKRTSGSSAELVRAVEEYTQIEVEHSNLPTTFREAQRTALIRNEAVVKLRYVEESDFFVGAATVMVGDTGEPVQTSSGQFIYEDDDFAPDPNVEGVFRLKKDPTFEMTPEQYGYLDFPSLRQEKIRKMGLEAHVLDSRSFLCPLTAPCIHKADINVQLLDWTVEQIRATYGGYEEAKAYCDSKTSGESMAKEIHGERPDQGHSTEINTVRLGECYMRCDVDEDGIEEEVFLVVDMSDYKPIFYDYLENHFNKRPFEVVVGVETVPNRWYGVGIIQMLWDQNMYVDLQFNRINLKDSRESSITFADEQSVKEWKGGAAIQFGTDKVYRVEPGFDPNTRPPIWRWNGNEVSELGERLMGTAVQDMTTSFGVISAKDASASDLNNSRTATGVLNMERTANTLTRYTEIAQQAGIEALLKQSVILALENMPPMAMFFSKDGDTLHTLNKTEARTIEKDVRLFLTRARSTESLVTNQQATQIVEKYHMLYEQSPRQLMYTRPLYVGQLKALEIMDADEMLPPVDEAYLQQWQEQQQAAAQQAQQDNEPKEIINYKDAPGSIQAQMEQRAGLQPADEGERTAKMEVMKPKPQAKPQPKAA